MIIYGATTYVNELLKTALLKKATDIHFYPSSDIVLIFFRIHGRRVRYQEIKVEQYLLIINFFKFSAGMDIGEIRKPQDGALALSLDSTEVNLRLSTLPTKQHESLAIRILPKNEAMKLEDLLLFPFQLKQLKQSIDHKSGITLLTGPTGAGKSTLLYALIEELLTEYAYQVITLEDPIEKEINNVVQVQINEKAGITYHSGLKSALRHDPDIIMIGEIRDYETAKFAFHAAYTGHLVFTTLHANSAIGTIHRLLEMNIKPIDLKQNILAVASLELIPLISNGRATILELIDNPAITAYLQDYDQKVLHYDSFNYLKRKAVAYGYSNPSVLESKAKDPHSRTNLTFEKNRAIT